MATCQREPQTKPCCTTNVGGAACSGKPHVNLVYGGLYGEKLKRQEENMFTEASPEVISTNMCGSSREDALYMMQHYVRKLEGFSAIAHEVKRQFESSHGGIWQCIVGESFGTDYTHTGPYLHTRIHKTNIIVWRTVGKRKLAMDRRAQKAVKVDKKAPTETKKSGPKSRGPALNGGRYNMPPRQRIPVTAERADRKYVPASGYYTEDFLDNEDYMDYRPRDYPEDDNYDSRRYPARSHYTGGGYHADSYYERRGYPEDSYYGRRGYPDDPYPYDDEGKAYLDDGLYNWDQAYDRERYFSDNDDQARDDYTLRKRYDRADLDQPVRGYSQRYHPGGQYRDQVTDSVLDFGAVAGPAWPQYYRGY